MQTDEERQKWTEYFAATRDKPAHPLFDLLEEYLPDTGEAIDLGCGTGRGTLRLIQRGLSVTATDISDDAIDIVRQQAGDAPVALVNAPFQQLELGSYDVAVACFSLFFMSPDEHAQFWPRLVESIRPGGVFAGQFLGVNDTWRERDYAVHSRKDVERLLEGFDVLHLEEEEEDGTTATGEPKHWHVFHVIARKRAD